jgi:hypothetical protein
MMRPLRAFLLAVVAALVIGCSGSGSPPPTGGGGGGGGTGQLPPVGSVWFGSAFDPASLAVTDRATSLKAGSPMVAVGHFLQPKPPEDMTVTVSKQQSILHRLPITAAGPGKAFGIDLSAQKLDAGNYVVTFVDKNRRTLAAGTLVVTP